MKYSRNFFSKKRADEFVKELMKTKAENIEIWSFKDAFKQTQYQVKWYIWD